MNGKRKNSWSFRSKKPYILIGLIVLAALAANYLADLRSSRAKGGKEKEIATFVVRRGPLKISVIESGTIKARNQVVIKNEVEGKTTILYLIPEGTRVKKGDLLVELDASSLLDEKIDQQIRVQNAEAAFISARENLEVVKNQAEADVDKAKLSYKFAREDLTKYVEGEYPNQLKEAEAKLTLAREELTRSQEKLEWSRRLFNEKYISETEFRTDELTVKKNALNLELAKNDLELLKNYTHKRRLDQLKSDLKQARMALERTIRKAKADVAQAEANLKAKRAEFERQKDKLKKIERQIEKTKIYAPADGLVIYATSAQKGGFRHRVQPLEEGQVVRERQELIHLPVGRAAKAEVAIHESNLDKVRVGLPVKITVDALPGKVFFGRVAKIAPLPDAQSAFLNPDLKVYETDIYLDEAGDELRTGMSCKAEIIVEQYEEATYVPVQAVLRIGGKPVVYVMNGESFEPREVEIGWDNNRMVRIIRGLEPGEIVSMTPPLSEASLEPATDGDKIIKEVGSTGTEPASSSAQQPGRISGKKGEGVQGSIDRPGAAPSIGAGGISAGAAEKRSTRLKDLSPEQRERRRKFFESLSPEERERFRSMSREERRRFLQERMAGQ
ncbi:MAG: efflux RND transporter periplasmic adaptor subunit [Deltaproteobacteria bacterium]|nr:efflux RND transporter periplasmic adaptor subunit [Deltaproteobacteria bacterium]